jgi:hypothetical protein
MYLLSFLSRIPPNGFPPFQLGGPNPERGLLMKFNPLYPPFGGILGGSVYPDTTADKYQLIIPLLLLFDNEINFVVARGGQAKV